MTAPTKTYPIRKFSVEEERREEPMGTKTKYWFEREGTNWLFKEARRDTGEHWSEKAAYELAELLNLPVATVDLATLDEGDDVGSSHWRYSTPPGNSS